MAIALNFVYRKQRDFTIRVAKTKALISFAVTAKLICVFVFAYAKSQFSHDAAHLFPYIAEPLRFSKHEIVHDCVASEEEKLVFIICVS